MHTLAILRRGAVRRVEVDEPQKPKALAAHEDEVAVKVTVFAVASVMPQIDVGMPLPLKRVKAAQAITGFVDVKIAVRPCPPGQPQAGGLLSKAAH